jgi:CheY-like chemotaxis protein
VIRRPRILVVDDNLPLLDNISECLESEGFEVVLASSGLAALERLAAAPPPEVALVDLRMPGLSGEALLARLRASPGCEQMRVVLISGMAPAGARAAVHAVLEKPFGVDRLLSTVRAQLHAAGEAAGALLDAAPDRRPAR